jgi:hypothetical protein
MHGAPRFVFTPWRLGTVLATGLLTAGILAGLLAVSCRPPASTTAVAPTTQAAAAPAAAPAMPPIFQDVTAASGVDFRPRNGEEADNFSILEALGCGVALLDYDGDGLLDIFLVGGGEYAGPTKKHIVGLRNRLYKNLGNWHFRDVTAEVGLDSVPLFYSHGVAVADYDRDGWPDLLVTGYGRLALYHNVSDGKGGRRFVEVTEQAGLHDDLWSTSAAWADLDGDGYPDLYVCHYVDWSWKTDIVCSGQTKDYPRDLCTPERFGSRPHYLFRNNRDGTFTEVGKQAGLRRNNRADDGKGLGVIIADLNDDRRPDIYVCNDTTDSLLYLNLGKCRFNECGMQAGVARDDMGRIDGSMGVDVGDYDGCGRPSLWVTNYEEQLPNLFRNRPYGDLLTFTYESQTSGVARLNRNAVSWGTGFFDFDNDGWEDLVIANGHLFRHTTVGQVPQLASLMHNVPHPRRKGERWFNDVTDQGGSYFGKLHRGRGLAIGDLDNDGRPDLVISHVNEPVVILRNVPPADPGERNHWLGVDLQGRGHADVVGAKATLEVEGRRLTRFTKGGGSYLSSGDRRLLFGLAKAEQAGRLTVAWPSGRTEYWDGLPIDRYHRLEEGSGTPCPPVAPGSPGSGPR